MRITVSTLPSSVDDFSPPVTVANAYSYIPRVDLTSPFWEGVSYGDVHAMMVKAKAGHALFLRDVMAYLLRETTINPPACALPTAMSSQWEVYAESAFRDIGSAKRHVTSILRSPDCTLTWYCFAKNTMAFNQVVTDMTWLRQSAQWIIDALVSFGFVLPSTGGEVFSFAEKGQQFISQSTGVRVARKAAWRTVSKLAERADAYRRTSPPLRLSAIRLFGSLSRDADTVGDIDIQMHLVRDLPDGAAQHEEEVRCYFERCYAYAEEQGLDIRGNDVDDGESAILRHLDKQFSRLKGVSLFRLGEDGLSGFDVKFFSLLPDEPPGVISSEGLVDVSASVEAGKLVVRS